MIRTEDHIEIEKLGGLAGVGLPGSHIRCRVQLSGSDLSPAERDLIAALFTGKSGSGTSPGKGADFFRYRVTLQSADGRHVAEVSEGVLPESIQDRLEDELI